MRIVVFGSGYVGLVSAACFADLGNHVTVVDIHEPRIRSLNEGKIPIFEPGLAEIVERARSLKSLEFVLSANAALHAADVVFVAVGTPPGAEGCADLSAVYSVARQVADHPRSKDSSKPLVFVVKSTVPVGTGDACQKLLPDSVLVMSNPEFLKEGAAIDDFRRPERVVLGGNDPRGFELLKSLYEPFVRNGAPILTMSRRSAELGKYAANAFLATKIGFINSMARLCEATECDVYEVKNVLGSDSRIGSQFLHPGAGYGGSCFPKDTLALIQSGRAHEVRLSIVEAAVQTNTEQKEYFARKCVQWAKKLQAKTVAVWGLAFKAETDDVRDAPSLETVRALLKMGLRVRGYDPAAGLNFKREVPEITLCEDPYETLQGADLLVVMTEWNVFKQPDFDKMAELLRNRVILDAKNLYRHFDLSKKSWTCVGVGVKTAGNASQQEWQRE